jgi:hypothetical protein
MYRLLLSLVTIITFFIISATSSVSEPLAMFFLGADLSLCFLRNRMSYVVGHIR